MVGVSIATLGVGMTADTAGLQAGLNKAASSVGKFTNDVNSSTSKLENFSSKLTGMLGPLATLIGMGGAGAFFTKGIIDASQLEKDVLAIETLTGSVQIAEQTMADLQQFAASTPFQMADLTQATKMLLAFGIEAENVQDNLFVLGNLAAVSGASVSELAQIFGKVKAQGKVTAETLDQLAERAIPVGPALAEHFGVAETAIRKMVSDGLVQFSDLQQALFNVGGAGGQLGDAMSKMSETTAGQFSTLQDNIAMLGVEIAEAFLPALNDIMQSAIRVAQGLKSFMESARAIGEAMSESSNGLISFNSALKFLRIAAFTAVIPAIIKIVKALKNLAKAAIVAQASTGVGLVTALGSLAGAMALELGIDAIFGPIEDGAENAGKEVGVLSKSLKDLEKQAQAIGNIEAIGSKEPEQDKFAGRSLQDLEQMKSKIESVDQERVDLMQRLAARVVEMKKDGEDFERFQKGINTLQKQHNDELKRHKELEDEILKRKKDQKKAAQEQENQAKRLVDSLATQSDKYQQQIDEIERLREAGAFGAGDVGDAIAAELTAKVEAKVQSDIDAIIQKQNEQEKQRLEAWERAADNAAKDSTTGLVRAGSKEMFEQVAKAQFKKDNPLASFQKKNNETAKKQLDELRDVNVNLRNLSGVVSGDGMAAAGGPNSNTIQPVGLGG